MWRVPHLDYRLRLGLLAYGIVILLWLSLEDNQIWPVTILGTGTAFLGMLSFLSRRYGAHQFEGRSLLMLGVVAGGITGASAVASVAALMFFKSAWHSHIYPDFPPQLILDMLSRLPAWGLAGALLGLGAALWLVSIDTTGKAEAV